jgi:hypothetical protein
MKTIIIRCVVASALLAAGAWPAWAGALKTSLADTPRESTRSADYQPLVVSVPHHLSESEAKRRIEDALASLQKDYGYMLTLQQQVWTGYHLRFLARILGEEAPGTIDITKDRVNVRVLMPSSLSLFTTMAQPVLQKQGALILARQ